MKKSYEKTSHVLFAQMGADLILATDDLPDTKFSSLLHAQALLVRTQEQPDDHQPTYTDHNKAAELQASLGNVCRQQIFARIKESIGIMLDESLDVAVQKKLVIFCRVIDEGVGQTEFAANIEVKDGKADTITQAIMDFLHDVDVPLERVSGIGTDGAAVMVGRLNGVVVKLQKQNPKLVGTWCVAHRLALVCQWASKSVPYLETVQTTLANIFDFFHYSACRYNKLRELKELMKTQVRKFKKPTNVRWLSLHESVKAVYSAWGCLCLALEREAASKNTGGAKAREILKAVKSYKFIGVICLLCDILSTLTRCSKVFQKDSIDIRQVEDMLAATSATLKDLAEHPGSVLQDFFTQVADSGHFQGITVTGSEDIVRRIRTDFVREIHQEMDKRFPANDMAVLKDLATVLDPSHLPHTQEEIREHGKEALERLLTRYEEIDGEAARDSFRLFKALLGKHREKGLQAMYQHMLLQCTETFPEFVTLAEISTTIPVTSVPCERGFSSQNLIHTSLRSCLNIKPITCCCMV
ncbi:hypothetical protein C0Q70_15223 [Pomacea canaliculata]|uniref:Uncharacterized protein n=1 Tax=Pomacea canaliculata TaxID=400727 RepID=A0A2T7NU69_POMCA|nr:hypothetical protein C0Q70_15223 [Pomacea canaliculata]